VVGAAPSSSGESSKPLLPMAKAIEAAFRDSTDRLCGPPDCLPDLIASGLPSAAVSGDVWIPSTDQEVDVRGLGATALQPVSVTLLRDSPLGPLGTRCAGLSCQYQPLKGSALGT
jgi:hypothetical protein